MANPKPQQLKFKNLNVGNLLTFLDNANAGKFNHTFEINPSTGTIQCRAFPQDRKFVKFTAVNLADIMLIETIPADLETLKLPIYAMDKLKSALKVIEDNSIEECSGHIEYSADDTNGGFVASSVHFKAKKISNKVKATDQLMFSFITAEKFKDLSSREGYMAKFDADRDFRSKLADLFTLEGDNTFTLKYDKKGKKLTFFAGDSWSYDFEGADIPSDVDFAYDIPKEAINRLTLPLYTITIAKQESGHTNMVAFADEMNIIANFIVAHDPNKVAVKK